jgi:membrane protease YdiL (CAAX protease family)
VNATAPRSDGFSTAVLVEGGLVLLALVLAWIFRIPLREQFPPFGEPLAAAVLRGVVATVPMLLMFWWLANSRRPALRELREQVDWLVREMFPAGSIAQFAMVAALAGVGEELLFRGVLQTKFAAWTTPLAGLIIASLLFGLAHALSKLYFLFAIAVGGFLGWLRFEYNDLVAPMLAHGIYDFVALVYLSRNIARRDQAELPADQPSPPHNSTPPHESTDH